MYHPMKLYHRRGFPGNGLYIKHDPRVKQILRQSIIVCDMRHMRNMPNDKRDLLLS